MVYDPSESSSKVSPRKVAANRRNARKSTGPRTAAGKARSRGNATTHGLFAAADVLMPDEDADARCQLRRAFIDRLRPQDLLELSFVERIVDAQWKMLRLSRVETPVLCHTCPTVLDKTREEILRLVLKSGGRVSVSDFDPHQTIDRYATYRQRLETSVSRSLRELRQLQSQFEGELPPSPFADAEECNEQIDETEYNQSESSIPQNEPTDATSDPSPGPAEGYEPVSDVPSTQGTANTDAGSDVRT
jgi:hypothetical protein